MFFSTSNPNSARAFYDEASYGQTTIVGGSGGEGSAADVYGPYTLGSATCNVSTIRNEAVAAADAEIDYNRYDRIVISWAHPACGSGGAGTVRGSYIGLFDGSHQYASIAWDFNAALGDAASARIGGVALHEYGHNLGVWHANALECGGAAISGGTCSSSEYGDPADVMGNTGGYGHPNAAHKDTLTWLGGGRTHDVGASGTYTLNGFEHPAGVKALRIPRTRDGNGAVTGYYYLEARRPNPTWGTFLSGRAEYDGGVLIHATNAAALCTSVCGPDFSGAGGGGDTHLIDTRPASQSGAADFNDAPLAVGESYSDPAAGVAITVTAADGNGVAVSVTLSPPTPAIQTVVYPENAGIVSGGGTFGVGQAATLVATPAPGYSFLRWREQRTSQSFPNPYTFAVAGDRMLEAVFGPGPSQPAPDNDSFTAPAILDTLPARVTAGTEGARLDTGEPSSVCGTAAPLGKTLWYSVTPQTASTLVISTAGSSFDTAVAVYTGDLVDALVQVACNDNNGSSPQAAVAIAAQANTTYRIQVGGVGWASGTLALDVSASAAPPQPNPNPTPNPNPSPSPTGVDLAITVDDGLTAATPGSVLSYTIVATNRGAAAASGATVQSTIPNGLAGARWTCTATAGSNCGEALGFGNIAARVDLAAGGSATFLVQGTVSLNGGRLINRARVVAPAGVTDSVPANNSATDADQIVRPADRFAAPTAVGRLGATSSRYAADTRRATTEPAEPTALPGCGTIGKTVWYTVRPTASGTVAISTADSDFDTVLAVYTGPTPASLTRVACNDNADDAQARLTFAAQAGQLYRVQVGGRQAAGGNLVVEFAAGPANDAFQRAAPLRLGDVRSAAGRVSVSTTWATTEASEPKSTQCGAIGKTSWYSFTPTRTGPVTVSTAGSTFNTVVAVYRGRALGGLTPLRCNDNAGGTVQSRVTFMARAGETYRIQVGGRDGAAGTLNLNLLAGS